MLCCMIFIILRNLRKIIIMIKKKKFGDTIKEQHIASANDRLYKFILRDGNVRGVILKATRMVNEMRANHELGIIETIVLGHAYIACGLLSANIKGSDKTGIQIECSGPIKGLNVESNAFNEVRGYLKNVPIPVDKPLDDLNLSPFFGAGFLTVTKNIEDSKMPFSGTVMLRHGNIAEDMAYYFTTSEQIPTSFVLSIYFDKDGNATGAGGMFLQALPGADEGIILSLEKTIKNFPSLGAAFSTGKTPVEILEETFKDYSPEFLADTRVEFMCHCKKERMLQYLAALPQHDIEDIIENGPFPVEIRCHNCNTMYLFEKEEIEEIKKRVH